AGLKEPEPQDLVSASVLLATPEQAAQKMTNPWILLKTRALGELVPEAGLKLEQLIDKSPMPREISLFLLQDHHVRLAELEVARYSAWLPRIRRDAVRKKEQESERLGQEAKKRMKRPRQGGDAAPRTRSSFPPQRTRGIESGKILLLRETPRRTARKWN